MFLNMGVICNACLEVKGTGSFILEVSMITFSGTAMREERLFALGIVKQLKAAVQLCSELGRVNMVVGCR